MEFTGLNELREKYLTFFEGKGHLRLPSFSLVPQGDKSLLLINSGMAPLKKYFTGEQEPPRARVTTCQKCIRTPDIENVGISARHGTYFEMLGNFSFGDYFKKEAISWAWEFLVDVLKMPVDLLYISVYEEDDEAYTIWKKDIGIAEDHLVRLGKADNFWEHGAGPCGPDSEIFFDRGEKYGCGYENCGPGCDCDRFIEVWNLVFTQFDNDGAGNYTELATKNIDTGMGLERLACVMQGVDNLFEVDTIQNIMQHVIRIAGVNYHDNDKQDVSLRVITDHIRSTTFMIGDGVMPSNEGRGYVLRRLLRRAARHGRLLGITEPFLAEVATTVIAENAAAYPNLVEKRDFILNVLQNEEESFHQTIDAGLKLLDQMVARTKKMLSAPDAFKLADTYGFPLDLTKEILTERHLQVDELGFAALVQEQRERSRKARQDADTDAWAGGDSITKELPQTLFMGYDTMQTQSFVEAILSGDKKIYVLEPGVQATLVLDQSPFYATSGGQAGDTGTIETEDTCFEVVSTTKTEQGVYLHHGSIVRGEALSAGTTVNANVDVHKRHATMRNHTAAHLLQAALREVLGSHVEQAGQLVNDQVLRFDFTHFAALTQEEIAAVELFINRAILNALPVVVEEMPLAQAKKLGAMALFGEKYGDTVRVVLAGDLSMELCGGTHVNNTGRIGLFKIESETSVAAGVRRIVALTGYSLLEHVAEQEALLRHAAQALKIGNMQDITQRILSVVSDVRAKDREIEHLKAQLSALQSQGMFDNAVAVGPVQVVTADVGEAGAQELRNLCDAARERNGAVVFVAAGRDSEKGTVTFAAACTEAAVKAGVHAGNLVREVAKIAGGSGGGKPHSAMAGAKDPTKAKEALAAVENLVANML